MARTQGEPQDEPRWYRKFIRREGDMVIREGLSYKANGLLECVGHTEESLMCMINRAVRLCIPRRLPYNKGDPYPPYDGPSFELVGIETCPDCVIIRVRGPVGALELLWKVTYQHEAVWSHIMGCPVLIRSVTASNHDDIEKWLKCSLLYVEHGGEIFSNLPHRAFMQNFADGGWTVVKKTTRPEAKMYFPYDRM